MTLKKGDFITIEYTGKIEDGTIFDTTDPKLGKELGLDGTFEPATLCLGEGQLLKGLDMGLIGKELGTYTIQVPAELGFGKKNAKLLQLIPLRQFKKQNLMPQVGMEMNIDDKYGVIKSVSGGRVIVDFNHPLSGRDLVYEVTVKAIVTDVKKQLEALLEFVGLPHTGITVEKDHAIIKINPLPPQEMAEMLNKKITGLTTITTVSYEQGEKPATKEPKAEKSADDKN